MAETDRASLENRADKYERASLSDNTLYVYAMAWKDFEEFCRTKLHESSLPASPEAVRLYITFLDQQSVRTIDVKLAAIARKHRDTGYQDPTIDERVKSVMSGIRRRINASPVKKAPVLPEELSRMINALPDTVTGKRDKAILLVGFSGAFRRSELVGLILKDIHFGKDGMTIKLNRSKTDQEGTQDIEKSIPKLKSEMCPVDALREWLKIANIKDGAVFRKVDKWGHIRKVALTPQSVALIVKRSAEAAGIDSENLAGHSLRSGFVTAAFRAKQPEWAIQKQTGHRSLITLRGYNQDKGEGASDAVRSILGE